MKLLTILVLCALAVGCGYGSHSQMQSPGTVPTISQLMPTSVNHGDPGFNLTVTGAKFASGAFVTFNNQQMMTTWTNSGQVVAAIPSAAIASAGTVNVIVTNPATGGGGLYGGGGTAAAPSTPVQFTIN